MTDAVPFLVGVLGGVPDASAPGAAFSWGSWRFANGARIEIIEPRGADGFLHRFLAQRGPGIHHVTFKVPSLGEACRGAQALGYRVVGYNDTNPSWKEAFLHPKEALGIVVQFAEASGPPPRWLPLPAGPPDPPEPVAIVGLRVRARSLERADVQWRDVLAGEPAEEDGGRVYRWAGSPMRIAVEVDPGAEEGPVALEVMGRKPVTLGPQPVPALGTVFRGLPARPGAPGSPSSS
jgi:methylmalonyl-CoA/ethylmalonyl-CoA epimerase